MDARNLHERTEFAWTHGICMDAPLNLHAGVVEIVSGGFDQSSPVQPVVELGLGGSLSVTHIRTQKQKDGWKSSCLKKSQKIQKIQKKTKKIQKIQKKTENLKIVKNGQKI